MRKLLFPVLMLLLAYSCNSRNFNDDQVRVLSGDTLNFSTDAFDVFVRLDTLKPCVYPVFTADSLFEGAPFALDVLAEHNIKGSFFFTGKFLRDSTNVPVLKRIIGEEHYVGPHSDAHILLAEWDRNRTPLVSDDSLKRDMQANLAELARFGIRAENISFTIPPFEWCSKNHAHAYRRLGILPINPTPGIETYRDYTTPDLPYYWSAERMVRQLFDYEKTHNLNGAIIIFHLGTEEARTDKLYHHLPAILDTLQGRGYTFCRLPS